MTAVVSIVTPVYNGGRYLAECIESVIAQTYADWRYDIVDNCSTDDTRAIAERYASIDSRIHVHAASEFVPVVASFNRATTFLAPESVFCKPMMADDRLSPECLEKMVAAASARPQVGLVCCVWTTASGPMFGRFPPAEEAVTYMRGRDAARLAFLEDRHFFGSPTSTLIRADLVRARTPYFYDEDNIHPDTRSVFRRAAGFRLRVRPRSACLPARARRHCDVPAGARRHGEHHRRAALHADQVRAGLL